MQLPYLKKAPIYAASVALTLFYRIDISPAQGRQAADDNRPPRQTISSYCDNYVAETLQSSHGMRLTWPTWYNPVPVFISAADTGQEIYIQTVYRTFDRMTAATEGRLRFVQVYQPRLSRMSIFIQDGSKGNPIATGEKGGEARYVGLNQASRDPMGELRVTIVINTRLSGSNQSEEQLQQRVYRLALHELGHGIGLWGHSANPGDIMYPAPTVNDLSRRDINTIRILYGLAPQ